MAREHEFSYTVPKGGRSSIIVLVGIWATLALFQRGIAVSFHVLS